MEPKKSIKRICLWSSPRNVSTAFMYSWAQRPDTLVIDEPLYGHFLTQSGALHPGSKEILDSMECDGIAVQQQMAYGDFGKSVVFFKHMSHHMLHLPLDFMKEMVNLFFIRDPQRIIASYSQVIENPTLEDIGIATQWKQYQFAQANRYQTIILDSELLLLSPEKILTQLCAAIGIPFYKEMLNWSAGPKAEDGIWAKYWYAQVHQSTGFGKAGNKTLVVPDRLMGLYEEALGYYEKMKGESGEW
jgi:hypothetical protein